ncbi:protein disulfide oxidoreductase [Vibrio nigripulchritudo]|uniref:protein disulfide oxidoreductase n=1 Tax=Vibrio nigripulchritudo TaxID=28173 RepID=UPI0003B18221|nr:protein disulfide oxidoreductase [Vibrio nigripulchritudo]CCN72724.1 putative Thioredoxin family protein [Vibrio nigripulchritudo SFn118]
MFKIIRNLTGYLLLIVLITGLLDWWRTKHVDFYDMPETRGMTIDGTYVDLKELSKEKPVLVYFWATWCGVCTLTSPTIDLLSGHYEVVSIALASGEDERLQEYMTHKNYDFKVINDLKGSINQYWRAQVTPTIAIVNDGEIHSMTTGFSTPWGLWLRLLLA